MKTLTTDVVVVGAGAAGLLAAVAARRAGRETILVESTSALGGSTATDTGHVWLPGHPWALRGAKADPSDAVQRYLAAILGSPTPASSAERRQAFVRTAPLVGRWLDDQGIRMAVTKSRVDFHQSAPGSRPSGRVVVSLPYDRRQLGSWGSRLRTSAYGLEIAPRSPRGAVTAAQAVAQRILNPTKDLVQGGTGLVAQLASAATRNGVTIWLDTPMTDVLSEGSRATGVRILREGTEVELRANEAVILAAGGFEANQELRQEYLPLPTDRAWSTGYAGNTGDALRALQRLGAPVAEMDEAWWTLVSVFGDTAYRMTAERSRPFSLIVDQAGDRFINEAGPMPQIGRHLYDRNRGVRAIPSWLVMDSRHRQRYPLGPWLPGSSPRRDDESVVRAASLNELAARLGIDVAGLLGTVVRFNGFAKKGRDGDFYRGDSLQDRTNGDPSQRKNPCLGTLEQGPYWAVRLYPGDAGTKGGVLIDAWSRVLGPDDRPLLDGLYAVTGTAASLFRSTAPANGAALGSALVEAYRAVLSITGAPEVGSEA